MVCLDCTLDDRLALSDAAGPDAGGGQHAALHTYCRRRLMRETREFPGALQALLRPLRPPSVAAPTSADADALVRGALECGDLRELLCEGIYTEDGAVRNLLDLGAYAAALDAALSVGVHGCTDARTSSR